MTGFISYCGGLPAPESADNPLGYKFSWSSRGVLLALLNSAKLYSKGQLLEVEGKDLMAHAKPYHINPAFVSPLFLACHEPTPLTISSHVFTCRPSSLTPTATRLPSASDTKFPKPRRSSEEPFATKVSPSSSRLSSTLAS